jgi:hypothetical protein
MKISFLAKIPGNLPEKHAGITFADRPDLTIHLTGDNFEFMAWGDPIFDDRFMADLPERLSTGFVTGNLSGHYYFCINDIARNEITFGTSPFSIVPLYYCVKDSDIILSDNVFTIAGYAGLRNVSARFIIESLLFNYPLYNCSLVEGITLLESGSALVAATSGIRKVRHTAPEEWFADCPVTWRKSVPAMTDIFLEAVEKYLPGENYLTALTGGFDSRTLVAAGLFHGRTFTGYCFGSAQEGDLGMAAEISSRAGLPFVPVLLDSDYVRNESLEAGKEFITSSSGTGTFSRAHYIYAASLLCNRSGYLVTGNFGSEVLRAVHSPGVMVSPLLYQVFQSDGPEEAVAILKNSALLRFLSADVADNETRNLEEVVSALPCFDVKYRGLGKNMQLYLFIFEETFRKYFGSEITGQWNRVINRTPFLDCHFLRELFSTGLAGVHSGFMEGHPGRRFKGQILYASVINRAAPHLGAYFTDKGYRPDDLLTLTGKARILAGWLRKRMSRGLHPPADPMAVLEAWDHNRSWYESLPVSDDLFNRREIDLLRGPGFSIEKARLYSLIFAADYLRNLSKPDGQDLPAY